MNQKAKVCLTTYIYGIKYQSYIPLLLYSCHKAYPEYDVVLFLYEKLDPEIKFQIELLELTNKVIIHEGHFNDCPGMSPLKSKALRWVLWDDIFDEYDYLYTVDIDMFYIREPIPLHSQHVEHMNFLGLPMSNLRRKLNFNPYSPGALRFRLKSAGLRSFLNYINTTSETRLSGLHFVDIKQYYSILNDKKRMKFTRDIYTNKYLSYVLFPNNEVFLANMLTQLGFDISRMGIQSNPVDMLDFSKPKRLEFRPHHGIHLGIFRKDTADIPDNSKVILDSSVYSYYINEFINESLEDKTFLKLSKYFSPDITQYIARLKHYYKIT